MYKYLLCWRYLRTRYIALVSIISVTLGVATMIVVNSVMAGFSSEMQNRIHGILSDLVFESHSLDGMYDADWHIEQIRKVAGADIEALTPTVVSTGLMIMQFGNNSHTREVTIVGVDEQTQRGVSELSNFVQHPENRKNFGFQLHESGYDVRDHQAGPEAPDRPEMAHAGWQRRREIARIQAFQNEMFQKRGDSRLDRGASDAGATQPDDASDAPSVPSLDPFASASRAEPGQATQFDPAKDQHTGIVLGIGLASVRTTEGKDRFLVLPGDDVKVIFPTVGSPPKATTDEFTIVDVYESKMSEYDSKFVFVPLRKFQQLRGMIDPNTGIGMVNAIQIKVKPGADLDAVRDKLRAAFRPELYGVYTWRDKQGPLLAAVQMEIAILNVLLFMIIAVAGFGILAIFYMIVVEKTRDIGILKSLGAPARGVMGIFLSYGISLGMVGSGAGLVIGLLLVRYINQIADLVGRVTGQRIFDPSIYYFYSIPTIVELRTVICIVAGAVFIAVAASILPARRAAGLHPVEALRYE
jgi:lipoprotein-releasing system permease protein